MPKSKSIVVCTPTVDGKFEHGMMLSVTAALYEMQKAGWKTILDYPRGSNIGVLRDLGVRAALDADTEYLLQIDSDTVIASNAYDSILKLIERDVDIVSGLYVGKQGDFVPIAAHYQGHHGRYQTVEEIPLDGSMVEVDAVGGGFLLVKTEVFRHLTPPYFHWFTGYPDMPDTPFSLRGCRNEETLQRIKTAAGRVDTWLKENPDKGLVDVPYTTLRDFLMFSSCAIPGVQHGEDYGFCYKAKAAGYKVWLDCSVMLGHIGSYIYTPRDYMMNKAYRESLNGHSETDNAGIVKVGV